MPPSFEELQGHRMSASEIDQLLEEKGVGVLSMAQDDDPYGIPLSFGYDGDEYLYFVFVGHSTEGRKVTYAERSDEVSFLVYDMASDTDWRSVIVSGSFERITPDEWDDAKEAMADNAYRPDLVTDMDVEDNPRVWALEVDDRSGRAVHAE